MGGIGKRQWKRMNTGSGLEQFPVFGNVTALKLLNAFGGDIRVLYEADKENNRRSSYCECKNSFRVLYIVETGTESAVPMHR